MSTKTTNVPRGQWPYVESTQSGVPRSLPGGSRWPRISIITPSLNQGRYIEETILSVANQGYPNCEHIIVDGASTDATLHIIERHRPLLSHVISEKDTGQSNAINKGMALATGDILTWLNADDRFAPGALFAAAIGLWTSGADMVAGVCELFDQDGPREAHLASAQPGFLRLEELLDLDGCWNVGRFFYQPEVLFTRDVWRRAGGYVEESLFYSMDYDLWLRFAQAGAKLHVVGRPIAQFRVHNEQKTSQPPVFQGELKRWRDQFCAFHGLSVPTAVQSTSKPALRVAFLNDHGFRYGAGIAHGRLAEAVAAAGHDVVPLKLADDAAYRIDGKWPSVADAVDAVMECTPDLVLLGNLHSAGADPQLAGALAARVPTACVLHDMWWMTGRCGYTLGACHKYPDGCDETCPTYTEYPALAPELIHAAWLSKRSVVLSAAGPALLANSPWTAAIAREAFGPDPRLKVEQIHLAFNVSELMPCDKMAARSDLGIPADAFAVLCPFELADERKGSRILLDALANLDIPELLLVTLSRSSAPAGVPVRCMRLPYTVDQRQLAKVYGAVDVLAGPSREETFGQIFIEASACGTPSVGFATSGVVSAVRHGMSGLLAGEFSSAALAEVIRQLHADPTLRTAMGFWGRYFAENEFSYAAAYYHLFCAMERLGFRHRTGLQSKISFPVVRGGLREPQLVPSTPRPAVATAELTEGPHPALGLSRFEWVTDRPAHLELSIHTPGEHLLIIRYRNTHAGQVLRIVSPSGTVEYRLARNGLTTDHLLVSKCHLEPGVNRITLECTRWSEPKRGALDQRRLGVMVTLFQAVRAG